MDSERAWAIKLFLNLGQMDTHILSGLYASVTFEKSSIVRLAWASVLPTLDDATRLTIAEALAMHAEDKDDRFLPKMIWYGIAPLVEKDMTQKIGKAQQGLTDTIQQRVQQIQGN